MFVWGKYVIATKNNLCLGRVFSQKFLIQKVNYIHHNPVSGKWMLAKDFIEYEHSSASFYEKQVVKHFRPVHYTDLYNFRRQKG
jgi:hypothetical protein